MQLLEPGALERDTKVGSIAKWVVAASNFTCQFCSSLTTFFFWVFFLLASMPTWAEYVNFLPSVLTKFVDGGVILFIGATGGFCAFFTDWSSSSFFSLPSSSLQLLVLTPSHHNEDEEEVKVALSKRSSSTAFVPPTVKDSRFHIGRVKPTAL